MSVSLARRLTARALLVSVLASSAVTLGTAVTAPASAQAAAPAPSAAGGLVVTDSTSYTQGDFLAIVGQVRNDWNRVAGFPVVTLELLDQSGSVLQTKDVNLNHSRLAPGEVGGFRTFQQKPGGYASFRVKDVERKPSFSVANHSFTVTIDSNEPTSSGRTIKGTVRNDNLTAVALPSVDLRFLDATGKVYDVKNTFPRVPAEQREVAAGASVPFEVARFNDDPYRADGSIVGVAESSSAPSPYPTEVGVTAVPKVKANEVGLVTGTVRGKGATGGPPTGTKVVVELLGREAGQPAFTVLRRATVEGTDTVRWELKPQRDIRYQLRVPTTATTIGSASGFTLTQVAFNVSTTGTTSGGTGILSGSVRPASRGAVVNLQQQVGGAWRNVASQRLSTSSTYRFTITKPKGQYTYRVVKPAATGNQIGIGPVMVYRVF